jgi:hypothetical protein
MMALPETPPIDYTNRDYLSLRTQGLALARRFVPEWTDHRSSDMGVVMIEQCAAMGDVLSFYTDRLAGEFLLDYVTDRTHMVQLMKLIGYSLPNGDAAVVTLSVTARAGSVDEQYLPAGSRFGSAQYSFETTQDRVFGYEALTANSDVNTDLLFVADNTNFVVGDTVVISSSTKAEEERTVTEAPSNISAVRVNTPPSAGYLVADAALIRVKVGLVPAIEGSEKFDILGSSDGNPGQSYALTSFPVIDDSEIIAVDEGGIAGSGLVTYTKVVTLLNSGPTDRHYTARTDAVGRLIVQFGDDTNGKIPPLGSGNIQALYRVGGGAGPNFLQPGAINRVVSAPTFVEKVTNTASPQGGSNAQTLEEARVLGPLSVKTNDRAVVADDYKSFALSVAGVAKASPKVHSSGWNSVAVYIVPSVGGLPTQALKDAVKASIDGGTTPANAKSLMTTTVLVVDPVFLTIDINLAVRVQTNSLQTTVTADVDTVVRDFFSLESVDFGDDMYQSDLTSLIEAVRGLASVSYVQHTIRPVAAAGQQTGSPTFGAITVGSLIQEETWTVEFKNPADTTEFDVSGSVSGSIGSGNLDTPFSVTNVLSFLISSGTQAPVVGDKWTFRTVAYNAQSIAVNDEEIPVLGTLTISATGGQ